MVLLGVGAGLSFPALMTLAMSGADAERRRARLRPVNTTAQVGGALGLAVLATLSTRRPPRGWPTATAHRTALTAGYQLAFTVAAVLLVVAVVVAATVLRPPERQRQEALEPAFSEA